jgi:CTP:molybdopterin cytidylyltransferase MocA
MIAALVLAAGQSSRMGTPKALLPTPSGLTFVAAIADCARSAGVASVIVVVGPPHADAIRPALPSGVTAAYNPDPSLGMLSSVQAGLSALPPTVDAVLVWPVDIPGVRVKTVRAILAAASALPRQLIIPQHGGRGGHPICIPQDRLPELAALDSARGLKALVDAQPQAVCRLDVDDPGVLVDIDTPEDFARLEKLK